MLLDDALRALFAEPVPVLEIRDPAGRPVAFLVRAEAMPADLAGLPSLQRVRPADLPRSARPKERLSKRQRDAAKREKLRVPVESA